MEKSTIQSFDDLPLTLSAPDIACALGVSRSCAYNLLHQENFPTIKLGRRLVVTKTKFIQWLEVQSSASDNMSPFK